MEQTDIHYRTGGTISHAGIEVLPAGKDIEYIVLESIEFKEEDYIRNSLKIPNNSVSLLLLCTR